jgi:superfamily I DNA/RNA helicase/CRISPR/Cas system-associated exonuclease Cas4 (RecB family)
VSATPEQRAVVTAPLEGPRLVDAGAGTGKTFTLVERARWLVEEGHLRPDQLLVVTFTKAAAEEIAGRLERAFGPRAAAGPTCGTFHAIAGDLLRAHAYETGISPDVRAIDDGRARGLFARAFADLRADRLGVDLRAFPLLDRPGALERDLATIALGLRARGVDAEEFARDALAQADVLATLTFGGVKETKVVHGVVLPKAGWPQPNPERTPDERRAESDRERRNVLVVAALLRRFDELLAAESLLTFGDILRLATTMLDQHAAIRSSLRARWLHAIVDEFQDTNPAQIAFLRALFGPELRPVLAVGDVRQAIYAFNGADPRGIVAFRDLLGCALHPLTENRRSVQPILDVAHAALARLGGVPAELHAPLRAHRGPAPADRVRLDIFEGDDALEQEAGAIAERIRALVEAGVSPRACAILLRTRRRAGAYAYALHAQGLAVERRGGVGFFDAPEIRELVAWLRLVDRPGDPGALVIALQSAAIGFGDGAVARLAQDALPYAAVVAPPPAEFDEVERARLARFRATLRALGALADVPLVEAVRTTIAVSGAELVRAVAGASVEQLRANLDKLVRLGADLLADRPSARIRDLIDEFDVRDTLELDEPEAELDGERVAIVTIHGAKGLEWDHVFVANCSPRAFPLQNSDARDAVSRLDERTGALALKHGIDGRPTLRWYLTMHAHDANGIVTKTPPDRNEEHRLFYVALTRARETVTVTGRRTVYGGESVYAGAIRAWLVDVGADRADQPLGVGAPAASDVGRAARQARSEDHLLRRASKQLARRREARGELPSRGRPLSYSAIARYETCPRRARYHDVLGLPELDDESAMRHGEEHGRDHAEPALVGRVVHGTLARITALRLAGESAERAEVVADALTDALAEEGGEDDAPLREQARRAVEHALPLVGPLRPIAAEQRFALTIEGVPLVGAIDLLADDAGRLTVVDYKTGRAPATEYALQFALYARAVAEERGERPRTRLLRIEADGARFEDVVPAGDERLKAAVVGAWTAQSDEPRPGRHCRSCPYAHDVCGAAPTG